ncbi:toll/interleukin-1 receptor domain-containing protein [Chlorobium limicola]
MNIFLSYARENHDRVEAVCRVLEANHHEVFFDKTDLQAGGKFNEEIHDAIRSSDLVIFFISPASVTKGCYARTELKWASEKWPDPAGRILPVMLEPTDFSIIPAVLKSVLTIYEPEGNLEAELLQLVAAEARKNFRENTKMSFRKGYKKGKSFGDKLMGN